MNFQQCTRVLPQGDPVSFSFKPLCKLTQVWALTEKPWLSFHIVKRCESESRSVVSDSLRVPGLYSPWNSPGQNTGVGSSPGDLPNPGIEPRSPTLQADSLPAEPQGKPENTAVGSLSLLQRIFLTQKSNWGLLHCRWFFTSKLPGIIHSRPQNKSWWI